MLFEGSLGYTLRYCLILVSLQNNLGPQRVFYVVVGGGGCGGDSGELAN